MLEQYSELHFIVVKASNFYVFYHEKIFEKSFIKESSLDVLNHASILFHFNIIPHSPDTNHNACLYFLFNPKVTRSVAASLDPKAWLSKSVGFKPGTFYFECNALSPLCYSNETRSRLGPCLPKEDHIPLLD